MTGVVVPLFKSGRPLTIAEKFDWPQNDFWTIEMLKVHQNSLPEHSVRIALAVLDDAQHNIERWVEDEGHPSYIAHAHQHLAMAWQIAERLEARRPPCPVIALPLPKRRRARKAKRGAP